MILQNKRECLNVGTVLAFRKPNVGTVPTFEMQIVGALVFYNTFMDQTFWPYFICILVWKIQTESGMKLPPIELDLDDISFGDNMKFSYQ